MQNKADKELYRISRRGFVGGAAAVTAGVALSHSALAAPSHQARLYARNQAGSSIIIATLGEASTINPFLTNESEGDWRCLMLFDRFVGIDPVGLLSNESGLASSWTLDNLTFTFTLRDANFSDGTPVTADDIAFAIMGHLKKATGSTRQGKYLSIAGAQEYADGTADAVSGIVVSDPKTIAITLGSPDASFLLNLRYIFPVPKAQLDGKDLAADDWFKNPIGAGPYTTTAADWTNGGDFIARKNPGYWDAGKPMIEEFTHRVIADSQEIVLALLSGDVDTSIYPAPTGADQLHGEARLDVLVPPFGSPQGWMFNFKNEWLAKKEVRRAIAMSLDTVQFAKDSLLGLGTSGIGPIAPDSWAYDKTLTQIPYDVEGAKALIAQSGMPDGTEIRFTVNSGNVLREDWLTYTEQALKAIGIKVIAEPQAYTELVSAVTEHQDYDACGVDFTGAFEDPGVLYDNFATGSSGNFLGYSNPDLDALMVQAKQELDVEKAKALYKQIQAVLMDDLPVFYAWYRPFLHCVDKTKYAGYTDSSLEEGLYQTLTSWTTVS